MPSPSRKPIAHLILESFWRQRRACSVAMAIAEETGGDDVRRVVVSALTTWFQMLGRCLENAGQAFRDAVLSGEVCRFSLPHGRVAIVAAAVLAAETGIA